MICGVIFFLLGAELSSSFVNHTPGFASRVYFKRDAIRIEVHRLHQVEMPLEGGPSFLRIHRAVIIEKQSGSILGDKLELFDFLPCTPREISTAVALLSGGSVEGRIRRKQLSVWPKHCVSVDCITLPENFNGTSIAGAVESKFDSKLNLRTNNCATFVDAYTKQTRLQLSA